MSEISRLMIFYNILLWILITCYNFIIYDKNIDLLYQVIASLFDILNILISFIYLLTLREVKDNLFTKKFLNNFKLVLLCFNIIPLISHIPIYNIALKQNNPLDLKYIILIIIISVNVVLGGLGLIYIFKKYFKTMVFICRAVKKNENHLRRSPLRANNLVHFPVETFNVENKQVPTAPVLEV